MKMENTKIENDKVIQLIKRVKKKKKKIIYIYIYIYKLYKILNI